MNKKVIQKKVFLLFIIQIVQKKNNGFLHTKYVIM